MRGLTAKNIWPHLDCLLLPASSMHLRCKMSAWHHQWWVRINLCNNEFKITNLSKLNCFVYWRNALDSNHINSKICSEEGQPGPIVTLY